MQFDSFARYILDEMAKVNVSDLSSWPSYTHPEFEGTSSVFQNKYGKKYSPEQLQSIIKNAVLEISKDPNISEVESEQLTAELVKAFKSGSLSSTTADVLSKRAIKQLLDFLKTKPDTSKKEIAQTMATAVKSIEQKPNQASQIATQAAQDTTEVIAQSQPAPEKKTEETPEASSVGETKDITNTLDQEFTLAEPAFDQVVEEINALNKRAAKRNIPLISIEKLGEEMVEKRHDPEKINSRPGIMVKIIKFHINVPQLQLPGGWKFIGRVDHTNIGNLIVSVPGSGHEEDLHKLYGNSQPSYCDHCNTTRNRTSTFVVQDAQGKLKRIGRQCLKDYMPGGERGVKNMLDYADYLSKIALGLRDWETKGGENEDYGGDNGGGGSSKYDYFQIKDTLGLALAYVRKLGYVSKSQASTAAQDGNYGVEATSTKVIDGITRGLQAKIQRDFGGLDKVAGVFKSELEAFNDYTENKEKYNKEAEQVIEWGKEYIAKQLETPSNMREYFQNLLTIINGAASSGVIPEKYVGYLVSIIPAYKKNIEAGKAEPTETKISNYVGEVGLPIGTVTTYNDRNKLKKAGVTDLKQFPYNGPIKVTITGSRTFERQGYGYYDQGGVSTMINMVDDQGNVYVYFASGSGDYQKGEQATIERALVKDHKEYTNKPTGKTVKQTVLTRVQMNFEPTKNESVSFAEYYGLVS
jgi:hypothetical protein